MRASICYPMDLIKSFWIKAAVISLSAFIVLRDLRYLFEVFDCNGYTFNLLIRMIFGLENDKVNGV